MSNLITLYIKEMTAAYKKIAKNGYKTQELIDQLILLESKFVNLLVKSNKFKQSFDLLINYLLLYKDMRSLKSYFRERESAFDDEFNHLLQSKDYLAICTKYKLNFLFCAFVVDKIKVSKEGLALYEKMKEIRNNIVTLHLHYALNRAKLFTKYINNILNFQDFVSIATEGLIVAVDKYCIDESKDKPTPFHMVAIGRMIAHLIAAQTASSPVKITYKPARQLYTIKKYLDDNPNASYEDAAKFMNMDVSEVIFLLHATQLIALQDSLDPSDSEGATDNAKFIDMLPDDRFESPFLQIENKMLLEQAKLVFNKSLPLIEKKIFFIMGVDFSGVDYEVLDDLLKND